MIPGSTGGQYYLVLNGSAEMAGEACDRWSVAHVPSTDGALEVHAGADGAEILLVASSKQQD